jgi:hypothetical protein
MAEWRRRAWRLGLGGAIIAAILVANWPVRRSVGTNFVITEVRLPLWVKAVDFIHRDANLDAAAAQVFAGVAGDEERALAALAWTRANIRPQPPTQPVVDDHIWHVIVRGYGMPDQQADVFTTLLTYGGTRAYWMVTGLPPDELPLSYVWIRDRWRVYDVAHGVIFRNHRGDLATPSELAADPGLIRAAARQAQLDVDRYGGHFAHYHPPFVPDVSRADLQMPVRRLWHEARSLVGMQGTEWRMRASGPSGAAKGQLR